jgi:hypothetical protein
MKHWFKFEISIGTILQLVAIGATAVSIYFHNKQEMAMMRELLTRHEVLLERHQQMLTTHQDDLIRVKTLLDERKAKL